MARPHALKKYSANIDIFFNELPEKAYTLSRLSILLEKEKFEWGLTFGHTPEYIVNYLLKIGKLRTTEIVATDFHIKKKIYSWQTDDEFTIISGLKSNSYFMYYSALFLHGLTQQIPKTYYLNFEHHLGKTKQSNKSNLTQIGIDRAFSQDQRKSTNTFSLEEKKIIITNSQNTGMLGVIHHKNAEQAFYYTNLERTLIDIVVRPAYSGGVFEVLEAYKLAKGKLKTKRMASYLKKLNYLYPYGQAIGFYLEKAGYEEADLKYFDNPKEFDFYLTYNIRNKAYSERWKLFHPKGF